MGSMQEYLKDTSVHHEEQARLERQRTTMEIEKAALEKKILESRVV